jgi:membrane-associated phospholipid phosphatase
MSAPRDSRLHLGYFHQVTAVSRRGLAQLVRASSHSRRALAARRLARDALLLAAAGAALVIALMLTLDAWEIGQMPPRGTPALWSLRILTDFGKDSYVLWALGLLVVLLPLVAAATHGARRMRLLALGTRLEFVFFAVLVPVLSGLVLKLVIGRGRPFVGGKANPFNFVPFDGTEAYYSMPSGHAVTAFALAFAVSAIWPRLSGPMYLYAIAIALTRLALLAHHPSDVVAGALVGIVGAMAVRYYFAARRLGFAIRGSGAIVTPPLPFPHRRKRVAGLQAAP